MTKQNRLLIFAISVIAILLWVGAATQSSTAQNRARQFKPGEMVETGGGMFAKILRCRGAGDTEECEVQYYRGDDEESTPRWENADLLRLADERVQSHKRHDEPQPDEAFTIAPKKAQVPQDRD